MRLFRRKPPIWETEEWDNLRWEEKISIWQRHRRYSILLGCLWLSVFLGSIVWWFSKYASAGAGSTGLYVILACTVLLSIILYLGGHLMD